MKTFFIGMALIACLYSAQTLKTTNSQTPPAPGTDLEDSVAYGPQLPCYYSNAVSQYVRRIFQDSKGNLWFSTNNGITRYDPTIKHRESTLDYQNFREKDGLCSANVWSIFQDSKGIIWAGTVNGLCRFNGSRFESYSIPNAKKSWVRAISEDSKGNLWFATADKGAFKFDGKTFQQLTKKNGLCSNDLTSILEDSKGNMWFGSMDGGLSKYNGKTFKNLVAGNEIGNNEVWTVYEDHNGMIWFSSEGFGLYRYSDEKLTQFGDKQGLHIGAVQCVYQDRQGRYWLGGGSGLVLYDGNMSFTVVGKNGPWGDGC